MSIGNTQSYLDWAALQAEDDDERDQREIAMLPANAHKECRELGKCSLREYKGYTTCSESGSCSLRTSYDYPPIPIRDMDWSATLDGYEGGDPIGRGRTESEAIADLKDQLP